MNTRNVRVAVLGLGRIGAPLTRQLLAANYSISAWNRTHSKAEELARAGVRICNTPVEAVRGAEFIVLSLLNGDAVEEVLFRLGTADAIASHSLVIDMSSIRPEQARDHARRLAKRDIGHVDAPITGGVIGADSGTLLIMAGGETANVNRAGTLLENFGRMIHIGDSGAGQFAKIANQLVMGATAVAVGEAILLAERNDIDANRILDAIRAGLAHSRALELYARRIISRNFQSRGAGASIQLKDLDHALAEADAKKLDLPLTREIRHLYSEMYEAYGDLDKSAVYLSISKDGGAEPAGKKRRTPG